MEFVRTVASSIASLWTFATIKFRSSVQRFALHFQAPLNFVEFLYGFAVEMIPILNQMAFGKTSQLPHASTHGA